MRKTIITCLCALSIMYACKNDPWELNRKSISDFNKQANLIAVIAIKNEIDPELANDLFTDFIKLILDRPPEGALQPQLNIEKEITLLSKKYNIEANRIAALLFEYCSNTGDCWWMIR